MHISSKRLVRLYSLFILVILSFSYSYSQNTDPEVVAVVVTNDVRRSNEHKKIINEQNSIERAQIVISTQLERIKELNRQAQNSLQTVQSIIRDSRKVVEIGVITTDIFNYQKEILKYAVGDIKLTALAIKSERRATLILSLLAVDIANATKGGENFRFSNSDRLKILNNALTRLRQIRGLSYGVLRKFKWANNGNFLKKILQEYDLADIYTTLNRAEMVQRALPKRINGILVSNNEVGTIRNGKEEAVVDANEVLRDNHPSRIPAQARINAKDIYNGDTNILFQTENTYAIDEDGDGSIDFEVDKATIDNHVINKPITLPFTRSLEEVAKNTDEFFWQSILDGIDPGNYRTLKRDELDDINIFSFGNKLHVNFINTITQTPSVWFVDEFGQDHSIPITTIRDWVKFN